MRVSYFHAQDTIQCQTFPCYIITGKEEFKSSHLIRIIHNHYKLKGFEIVRDQITLQNYSCLYSNHSTLSLFKRKRLLQVTFTQSPDRDIQRALIDISHNFHTDDHYLFIFNEITQVQQKNKWFQKLEKQGLHVHLYSSTIKEAFKILKLIAKKNENIQVTDEAIMLIACKTEGNLVIGSHIISLLAGQPETNFDSNSIVNFLENFMRYDVFDLANSITTQDSRRAIKITSYLLKNVEPSIILWAIIKEVRLWIVLSGQNSLSQQRTFKANNIWQSRQSAYLALLKAFKQKDLKKFMSTCLTIDLMIKGVVDGDVKQNFFVLVSALTTTHLNNYFV